MDESKVLTAANDAIDAAKKVSEQAAAAVATNDEIITAFGGKDHWKAGLKQIVEAAKNGGNREMLIEAIKAVNDEQEADRKTRGIMVGGRIASEEVAKVTDTWDKHFDYATFALQTRKVDVQNIRQVDLMNMAMQVAPKNDLQKGFQHAYMDLMIADAYKKARKGNHYRGHREELPKMMAICDYYRAHVNADILQKATVDPNDVADTANWVPTVFAPDFRELLWLEMRVEALFEILTYTGPGSVWSMPLDLTDYVGDLVPNTTSTTYALSNPFAASDPVQLGTILNDGKKDFTFQKHRGRAIFSGELDEDSIISVLERARTQILRAIAKASETAIINGQKSGAIDTAPGTFDARMSWDGLRKNIALQTGSTVAGANGPLTVTQLMQTVPALMGKYGVNPADGAIILPPVCLFQIITDTAVWTAEKYGPNATVLTGSLATVGGKPIVVSEFVSLGLNASGVIDGVTTDRTTALVVNRRQFLGVEKRAIEIGADYYRASDVTDVVGMRRLDFGKLMGNSEKVVASVVNVRST